MSLANVLAVREARGAVVLLGDPQQLDQPQRASHPDGAESIGARAPSRRSPDDSRRSRGVPADHLASCARRSARFTSEVFYEGRLQPLAGLECQRVIGPGALRRRRTCASSRCRTITVGTPPTRRPRRSPRLVDELLRPGVQCVELDLSTGRHGRPADRPADILVVAPYNAHVANRSRASRSARRRGGHGRQVPGTGSAGRHLLDGDVAAGGCASRHGVSLQSQPAQRGDVARQSACASSSRVRGCSSPTAGPRQQMRLANALCRFRELATLADLSSRR